jgi:excisionase family DNA binding protein
MDLNEWNSDLMTVEEAAPQLHVCEPTRAPQHRENSERPGWNRSIPEGRETVQREWLNTSEAARHLKVKSRTLAQWARERKVPGHRLSGSQRVTWRFLRAELDAMLLPSSAVPAEGRQ